MMLEQGDVKTAVRALETEDEKGGMKQEQGKNSAVRLLRREHEDGWRQNGGGMKQGLEKTQPSDS
jgi:hypothetical protein